jgi:thiamine monophosphate synthase
MAGADGAAVISAVLSAPEIASASQNLIDLIRGLRASER